MKPHWQKTVIPTTGEAEAERSTVQGLLVQQMQFKASLGNFMRPSQESKEESLPKMH